MAEVSGPTLMVAIQALDKEMRRLWQRVEAATGQEEADLQDLHFSFEGAAEELKAAYLQECRSAITLPEYEDLVRR